MRNRWTTRSGAPTAEALLSPRFTPPGGEGGIEPLKVNVFVYGTLRPDPLTGRSWGGLEDACELGVPAIATGAMFHAWGTDAGYPIVDFSRHGSVVGWLFLGVDADDSRLDDIDRVEIGAGYTEVTLVVDTDEGPVTAIAYNRAPEPGCARVESGDWQKEEHRIRVAYSLAQHPAGQS